MNCKICSASITAKGRSVYCSDSCMLIGQRRIVLERIKENRLTAKKAVIRQGRDCTKCGAPVTLSMDRPLLWICDGCSRKRRPPSQRPCKVCHTVFEVKKVDGKGRLKFCSEECVADDHRIRSREFERKKRALHNVHDGIHCLYCEQVILGRRRKYCNWMCREGHREAKRHLEREAA